MSPRSQARIRLVAAIAVAAAVAVVVAVVLLGRGKPRPTGTLAGPGGTIVSLGDSVPAGSQCDCRPFPDLLREDAMRRTGADTYLLNNADGGVTSTDVLAGISGDSSQVVTALRAATVVTVTVGANDFDEGAADTCDANLDCYGDRITSMQRNVAAIVTRIGELSGGKAKVLVTGYWGVFLDGTVGAARGPRYVRTARLLTQRVNAALAAAAESNSATFVDVDAAFTARVGADRTSLLASDGDHPNATGHRLIADALLAACRCA